MVFSLGMLDSAPTSLSATAVHWPVGFYNILLVKYSGKEQEVTSGYV